MKERRVRNAIMIFLISVTMVITCVPQVYAADGLKEGQAAWTQEASSASPDMAGTSAAGASALQNTTEDETRDVQAVTDSGSQNQSAIPNAEKSGTTADTDAASTSGTTSGTDAVNTSETTSGTDVAKTPDAAAGKNAEADPANASKNEKAPSEETAYPEQSWQETVDGTGITISAPEGAFPEGTKVSVTAVDSDKVLAAIRKAADEKKIQSEDIQAFDFDFYQGDTHHVEPKKDIQVSFQNVSIAEEDTVLAYHLDSTDAAAEKVALSNLDEKGDSVALTAIAFSIYAIVSTPAADTDGKIWIGDDDTTTYATINEAVGAATDGATVHIKGKFSENGSSAAGATISKNITLDVAGDTTMTGNGSANGITLTSGTKIQTSSGSTLTMTKFGTALTVNNGAEINDGTYVFRNNQSTTRGIYIDGKVKGSTDRDSIKITADDKTETNFYSGNATFENATLDVTSQTWTWKDAVKLNMNNVSMTLSGFGQGFYIDGGSSIVNSYLNMKEPGLRWGVVPWGSTGMTFQNGASTVKGSTIRIDYGSNAGISIGLGNANTTMTFEDSTLDFQNGGGSGSSGGAGGLNVNNGDVILSSTTIKGNGKNSGALFGAQANGRITLTNNSLVETPASKNPDNGLGQTGLNYVVTGGSHLIYYTDTYFNSASAPKPAIPTNGTANGNEKLDYVTLADPSVNTVTVLNSQGSYYNYVVSKASSDGKKHIWTPTNTVTFKVDPATEKFADGSTTDKQYATVRGNTLDLASSVQSSSNDVITNSASFPGTPTNTDSSKVFKGWYIEGTNTKFAPSMQVTEDITVVPRWAGMENISQYDMPLYGDILANTNTEHDKVMEAAPGATLTYTGRLNVLPVQDQITAMKNNFAGQGGNVDEITTEDIKSTFTASLTFPAEFTLPENLDDKVSLTVNNLFAISDVTESGSTVTVTMKLKEDYTTFSDLYTDVMSVPGILDVNIADVQAPNGSNNQKYTVKGEVSGTFTGKAATNSGNHIQNYDFSWKGIQLSSGKDATQEESDNTSIQHTIKIVVPIDYITAQDKLAGDILVGNNTEHDAPMDVDAGDNLTFTGRLNVVSIKDKIKAMKQNFENQGGNAAGIRTEYINSTFIAKLTFPSELTVPENPKAVLTENDLFVITDVTKSGGTVDVTMKLKKDYTKFTDLYKDVTNVADILDVDVSGIKVADTVQDNEQYTVKGEVSGTFVGKATTGSGNHIQKYNFSWTGVQTPDGRDAIQDPTEDPDSIQFTVKAHKPTPISFEDVLPGDILIGDNTEHDAVYTVNKGEVLTYTGRLYVQSVKDKIDSLKSRYTGSTDDIVTENIKSTFVTRLAIPEGLTILDTVTATLTENDLFEIKKVEKTGNAIEVTMSLKKDYANFTDLYKDVIAAPSVLNVDVSGIKVAETNAEDTLLTLKGTVTGTFTGKASVSSGKSEFYNFKWTSEQCMDPNGQDFILAGDSSNKMIQFTVKVMGSATPGTTGDEKTPATPDQTKTTPSKTNIITVIQVIIKTAGTVPKTGDNSNPALWLVLMMASCLGIVGLVHKVRKNRK